MATYSYEQTVTALGILPDNGVRLFVGLEGCTDIAFLKNLCASLRKENVDVPDLQALEEGGTLVFIPLGGSNLALWVGRLRGLNRPEFHLFDRDAVPPAVSPHQSTADRINALPGCVAVLTGKREIENYLHADAVSETCGVNVAVEDFNDVPLLVAQAVHAKSESTTPWEDLPEDKRRSKVSRAKTRLSASASQMTRSRLRQRDPQDEVVGWLGRARALLEQ